MFHDRSTKLRFYSSIEPIGSGKIFLLDCGHAGLSVPSQLSIDGDTSSFDRLLATLLSIMQLTNKNDPMYSLEIHTLVIDDISVFYWELKMLTFSDQVQKYQQLGELVNQIHNRYNCNVITTSWDSAFELGYQYQHKSTPQRKSLLPAGLFDHYQQVLYK